jgi:hypothetical protein
MADPVSKFRGTKAPVRAKARALPLPPGLAKRQQGLKNASTLAPGRASPSPAPPKSPSVMEQPGRVTAPGRPDAAPATRNVRAVQSLPVPPATGARRRATLPTGLAKQRG